MNRNVGVFPKNIPQTKGGTNKESLTNNQNGTGGVLGGLLKDTHVGGCTLKVDEQQQLEPKRHPS
jgi:hypothetical protein